MLVRRSPTCAEKSFSALFNLAFSLGPKTTKNWPDSKAEIAAVTPRPLWEIKWWWGSRREGQLCVSVESSPPVWSALSFPQTRSRPPTGTESAVWGTGSYPGGWSGRWSGSANRQTALSADLGRGDWNWSPRCTLGNSHRQKKLVNWTVGWSRYCRCSELSSRASHKF